MCMLCAHVHVLCMWGSLFSPIVVGRSWLRKMPAVLVVEGIVSKDYL